MKRYLEYFVEAKIEDKIRSHPAVQSYHPNRGEHFVNLKPGYHWSGQRSFGTETASEAHKMLKDVEKKRYVRITLKRKQ